MGWLDRLRRKNRHDRFIQLLIDQAEYTVRGADALLDYLHAPSKDKAAAANQLEKEADEVRRILIDELNHTFVTPLDREDIHALSRAIDDILDYANTTVDQLFILEVEPNDYLQRMVSLMRHAAREIHMSVQCLQGHPQVAEDHAVRAKALHNRMESVYREALADLFLQPEDAEHIMRMLKLRETYRHLSNAADRWDAAANVLTDIVVKMP